MFNKLFAGTFVLLERALDIRGERHRAILANVANQETPGYKAVSVDFKEAMRAFSDPTSSLSLEKTAPGHMTMNITGNPLISPSAVSRSNQSTRLDGNSVKPEKEMANLAENTLMYNATVQLMAGRFRGIKNVIRGGG